jgi:hypothetical protein
MDISKLSHGAKLVVAGTVAFLIVSFFNWQEVEFGDIATAGASMWNGWGVLAGLLAIALLVWEALRLANINVALPVGPAMTSAFLAILLVLFTFIKFVADNEFRTFWAWLGLALAIAIVVGAVMNMQAAGESMASVKEQLGAAGAAAAGAASAAKEAASSATKDGPSTAAEATSETESATDAAAETATQASEATSEAAAATADPTQPAASDAADAASDATEGTPPAQH